MADGFLPLDILEAMGGKIRKVQGHRPLILDDPRAMWIVQRGTAAVLASQVDKGIPVGIRHRLFNVSRGAPLFAVSDGRAGTANRLIVLSIEDAELYEIPFRRVRTMLRAANLELEEVVEDWVEKLSVFAAKDIESEAAEKLPNEGKFALAPGMSIRVERETTTWLQVEAGELTLFGIPELRIGKLPKFIPISGEVWLTAETACRVVMKSTQGIEDRSDLIRGLALFNSLFQTRLTLLAEQERINELKRLEQSTALQERALDAAIKNMAGVLNRNQSVEPRETLLLSAAAAVGKSIGIEIKPPPRSENMKLVKEPMEAIARASKVRHRRVLLAGEWWKQDCGALVGTLEDGNHPVALIRGKSGYEIIDSETGERTPVNTNTNLDLNPEAHMLYRRLPDNIKKPWHLTRFSLQGRMVDVCFILGLALVTTMLGMITPQATALIMDSAIPDANERLLIELGLALVGAALGAALFGLAQQIVSIRIAILSDSGTQSAMWDRLLKLRMSFFKRYTTGDLLSRVTAVSDVNREFNGQTLKSLLSSAMALLNLALLYYYNSKLALMALGLAVAIGIVSISFGLFIRRHYRALMELQGDFFGLVVQLVGAVSKLRVAGAQRRAFALWANKYTEQLELMLKAQRLEDYVMVFNGSVPIVSSILLFWMGVQLLTGDIAGGVAGGAGLTVGIFLAFNTAMGTFLAGATSLSSTVLETLDTLAKARRMTPLLEAEAEVDESKVDPGPLQGDITFSHVDFRYSEEGEKILNDLSFRIRPQEFVAFVGTSGSGKSTIFRLLLGFEMSETGRVAYDGKDLLGLDITAVRRQLGVVLQSGHINASSVFDNISANAPLTLSEVWEAVEDAGFGDDVREMPMGLHTMVSEGGTNLSGGQRQRLLIARALARYPKILLLDEATSALDNRTQAIVSESLMRRKVTRLVIAHRLSTIRNADRIYVLSGGQIQESGTFEELIAARGLFATMMARQVA